MQYCRLITNKIMMGAKISTASSSTTACWATNIRRLHHQLGNSAGADRHITSSRSDIVQCQQLVRPHDAAAATDHESSSSSSDHHDHRHHGGGVIVQHESSSSSSSSCDVFINHRGVDTKRTVAGLLYDRLVQLNLRPFLDNRSMQPGDKLYECINSGILSCKVGIAIFSPRYCESLFCLHELTMLVESKKKLIPIFCDVRPSQLHLPAAPHLIQEAPPHQNLKQLERFNNALQEAKYTVGLTFDSHTGNWSDLVSKTAEIVVKSLDQRTDY